MRIRETEKIRSFRAGRTGQEGTGLVNSPDLHLPVDVVFPVGGEVIVDD